MTHAHEFPTPSSTDAPTEIIAQDAAIASGESPLMSYSPKIHRVPIRELQSGVMITPGTKGPQDPNLPHDPEALRGPFPSIPRIRRHLGQAGLEATPAPAEKPTPDWLANYNRVTKFDPKNLLDQ